MRSKTDPVQKRVLMLSTYEDRRGGGCTLYHGGNEFNVDPDVFDEITASGLWVPVVDGAPVFPAAVEPEPEPEPVVVEEVL